MRRTGSTFALFFVVAFTGCPADKPTATPTVTRTGTRSVVGDTSPPPPDALVSPHGDTPTAPDPDGSNPKEPPAPDPGPPIGEPEELQPVDDSDVVVADDAPKDDEPEEDDAWAFPPSMGSIDLFPGIRLYKDSERLEVKGRVCMKDGPTLELLGCTTQGKTHESLLLFECSPKQLHLALVMIGLKPAPQVDQFGQRVALDKGQKVVLEVTWSADNAPAEDTSAPAAVEGRITRRVEDLIYDQRKKASMPRVGWVFTGSRNVMVPKPPNWDTKHEVYAAEYAGNVAATYHDPDALLDTPLLEGGDDTVYVAYSPRMPERGTKVILHLRGWKQGDGIETAAAKDPGEAPPKDAKTPDTPEAPTEDGGK